MASISLSGGLVSLAKMLSHTSSSISVALLELCSSYEATVSMTLTQLDADSWKLRGILVSLGPCSSVLAALGTLQVQGARLSNQRLTYI